MLSSPTLPPLLVAKSAGDRRDYRAIIGIAVVGLIAFLPLLVRHALWMWQRPHYQFFPLVILGAGILAYVRMRPPAQWQPGVPSVSAIGLATVWIFLAIADFLVSTWLGTISFLFLVMTLIYAAGGRQLCREALPAWLLLWLVLPPPLDLDRSLMFTLQNLTTEWSSAILDVLGVFHVRTGNVIDVDGKSLLVEQACSGINSLYSLLSCTLFLVMLSRRGWTRGTVLILAAIGWVLFANVVRVTGVVWCESRWGVPLSTGWRHEFFGVAMFFLAVGLLVSTDQFLAFLAVKPSSAGIDPAVAARGVRSASQDPGVTRNSPLASHAAIVIPAYLILTVVFLAAEKPKLETTLAATQLTAPQKALLPTKIEPWEQADFAIQTRDAYSFFGEQSSVWKYTTPRLTALVSLDYPFPSWHDLTWCYTAKGWSIEAQTVKADPACPGGYVEARMNQPTHRHGYLAFSEFDQVGQPFAARPGGLAASFFRHQNTFSRARARLGFGPDPLEDPQGPAYQLQVFVESFDRLPAEDESTVAKLLIEAGGKIRESLNSQH